MCLVGRARQATLLLACIVAAILIARTAYADQTNIFAALSSGVGGPQTLSPSGVASTRKALITVDLSTGAAQTRYSFELSTARGTAQPQLSLTYSSARGPGFAGGWQAPITIPSLQYLTDIYDTNQPGSELNS